MKKVSIVVAIYNVEPYLKECLDSVINQIHQNIEIIAVNDGSTDNSFKVLTEIAKTDSRIVIVDKPNGGLSDARNAGMNIATGDYLAFLDGDDTFHPKTISTMLDQLETNNADLVCCNYTYRWLGNKRPPEEKNFLEGLPPLLSKEEAISAHLQQKIIGSVAIKMFKRSICEKYSLRFPKGQMWEDMTFTYNYLIHIDKVAVLNESFYYYLQSEISITRDKDSLNVLDILKATTDVIEKNQNLYPDKFRKENQCYFTKTFIIILIYSYKCKDQQVYETLRKILKENRNKIGLALLDNSEKMLITLYRINYKLSRWTYFKIHKRNQLK